MSSLANTGTEPRPPKRKRGWRYWRNLLLFALASLVVVWIALAVFSGVREPSNWVHPRRLPVCCETPADVGFDYEEAEFVTNDGLMLRGWYLPSENGAAVTVAHGLSENRMQRFDVAWMLAERGYGVLVFDLRAHGESEGDVYTSGWEDVLGAVAYLQARDEVDADRIGAWGFSLGGMMSIQAAALSDDIRAVVSDGGHGPAAPQDMPPPQGLIDWLYLPYDLAFFPALDAQFPDFVHTSMVEAVRAIAPRPLLLIAAGGNSFEANVARHVYVAAGEGASLWEVPDVVHGGAHRAHREEYETRVLAFFDEALLPDD